MEVRTGISRILPAVLIACASITNADHPAWLTESWGVEYQFYYKKDEKVLQPTQYTSMVYDTNAVVRADSDEDPADIVLRRTRALLDDIAVMEGVVGLGAEEQILSQLLAEQQSIPRNDSLQRRALFEEACALRRRIAFSNPLLEGIDSLLFVKRRSGPDHCCDQFFGNKLSGGKGSLFVLRAPFGASPSLRDLLENSTVSGGRLNGKKISGDGGFLSPELSFDANEVYFAYTERESKEWTDSSCFNIFRVNADGSDLRKLTSGPFNDFDPCMLPNGRLAFISERRGGFGRCHGRPVPSYTLHSMNTDGSDIFPLSYHETNEWHPSVDNDGKIVYSRWDYVDRKDDIIAHNIWLCGPDGSDPRAPHGNYPEGGSKGTMRPLGEYNIKPVPDRSGIYVGVAGPHHGESYGALVLININIPDDNNVSQLKVLTPDANLEERPGGRLPGSFGTPWPLSEKYYLASFSTWRKRNHGLFLVDVFGNRILLYEDGGRHHCTDPIPFRPRDIPPQLSSKTNQGEDADTGPDAPKATISVTNVYTSDFEWPENTSIHALRIVQLQPKPTIKAEDPKVSHSKQANGRLVLGTVPVEEDGSAYFQAPVGKPIYFQALDSMGRAVQSMLSVTYVHPGEQLSCLGCHEDKWSIPAPSNPVAQSRPPSPMTPEMGGLEPITYPRHIQPILDRHCVSCHETKGKGPDLGDRTLAPVEGRSGPTSPWYQSYYNIEKHIWSTDGLVRSPAGDIGALGSRLMQHNKKWNGAILDSAHTGYHLPEEDLRMLTLWMDLGGPFFGSEVNPEEQLEGKKAIMPYDYDPNNPQGTEFDGNTVSRVPAKTVRERTNPVTINALRENSLVLTLTQPGAYTIRVMSLLGRCIEEHTVEGFGIKRITLKSQPSQITVCTVESTHGRTLRRIVPDLNAGL